MSSNDQANDEQSNDYSSRPGQNEYGVPVVKDDAAVAEEGLDASEAQLEKDDLDVDKSNIIEGDRTRGAAKKEGSYAEPGDEEGLPTDDGTSSGRQ